MSGFQLGTALVANRETVIIMMEKRFYPLGKLFALNGLDPIPAGVGLSEMIDDWTVWLERIKESVNDAKSGTPSLQASVEPLSVDEITWLPPVRRPRKLICMGTNYSGHAKEVASKALKMPYSFLKPPSNTLSGSGSVVTLLDISEMNDWEIELAVVIGKTARHVPEGDALGFVAGYSVMNDVSSRDWVAERPEFLGIDWVVGKAADGYAPMGPLLTPAEFVADPQDLDLELTLNGQVMQKGNTADMVFNVAQIIAHLSRFMTLEPGDIIATGTPEGVGFGRKPPVFLKDGDVVRCTIEGLGMLENRFVRQG